VKLFCQTFFFSKLLSSPYKIAHEAPQPLSPPPSPTTITVLSDDLLREIFLCLPAVTSLARAAFPCGDFLFSGPFF
jgi:hypothetical protein